MILLTKCDKKEDDNNTEIYRWDFTANFTIDGKSNSQYSATGTADFEKNGNNFTLTCNYSIGQVTFSDVILEGIVDGDSAHLTTESVILEFEADGSVIQEEVMFTVNPVDVSCKDALGDGTFKQRILPDGLWENGTFDFTAERHQ